MSKKNRRTERPAVPIQAQAAPEIVPLPEPQGALARYFHLFALGLLVVLTFAVYSPSLDDRYVWDDQPLIVENEDLIRGDLKGIFTHSLGQWGGFESNAYRPAQVLTHWADRKLFGPGPEAAHASSILWHALASFAVYLLWSSVSAKRTAALVAAALFAVHPAAVESVAYVAGRADTLSLLWGALCVTAFVAATRRGGALSALLFFVSAATFLLSALSKEAGLIFPLLCAVAVWRLSGRSIGGALGLSAAVHAAPAVLYALLRSGVTSAAAPPPKPMALGERLLFLPKALFDYTAMTLAPSEGNLHMEYLFGPYRREVQEPGYFLYFLFAAALGWAAYKTWRTAGRPVVFALFWTIVTLVPVLNILFKINAPVAAHWLYAPLGGLCFAGVAGLERASLRVPSPLRRKALWAVYAALALFFISRTGAYAAVWSDDISLYSYTAERVPSSFRVANNLCVALQKEKRYGEAMACFEKLKTETSNPMVDHNIQALRQEMSAAGV